MVLRRGRETCVDPVEPVDPVDPVDPVTSPREVSGKCAAATARVGDMIRCAPGVIF